MRNPLIGLILNSLLNDYNSGACDNTSAEEQEVLLRDLENIKDRFSDKLDKVLTIEETSEYLNVSRQTVNTYVKEGKLKPKKHLGGVLEFKLKDLKQFIKENRKSK